jgi:hypothetical protein
MGHHVACPQACALELTLDKWTFSSLDQKAFGLHDELRASPLQALGNAH